MDGQAAGNPESHRSAERETDGAPVVMFRGPRNPHVTQDTNQRKSVD
jgi:hypothetical protein